MKETNPESTFFNSQLTNLPIFLNCEFKKCGLYAWL